MNGKEMLERYTEMRQRIAMKKLRKQIGRNDACPCKSGKKFKKCCGA